MEIRFKEGKEKKSESKYHDVKVKSLKQRSTLTYVEEKNTNKIKVHKVHKMYHYN